MVEPAVSISLLDASKVYPGVLLQPLQVSQFTMHLSHVGQLERLTLATDAAPWLCDLLVVHDSHLQETVYFLCGR